MSDDRLLHDALEDAADTRHVVIGAGSLAAVVEVFRFQADNGLPRSVRCRSRCRRAGNAPAEMTAWGYADLIFSGLAMQPARSSRPASGSEHQFSHLGEMQGLPIFSHGFKEGIMATTPNPYSLLFVFCVLGFGLLLLFFLIAASIRVVPENARLSIFRLGRYVGERGPGLVILLPFIDKAVRIDVNDQLQRAQARQQMWGVVGETRTLVQADGQVEIAGQVWNAVSREPIPANTKIRVVKVLLEVEKLSPFNGSSM